jgi:hypothetical protein
MIFHLGHNKPGKCDRTRYTYIVIVGLPDNRLIVEDQKESSKTTCAFNEGNKTEGRRKERSIW